MYYNDYGECIANCPSSRDNTYQRGNDDFYETKFNNMYYDSLNYINSQGIGFDNDFLNRTKTNQTGNQFGNNPAVLEQMYPEVYKLINPMVCRMCDNNNQPVTEYMVEQMTDDIYDNVVNRVEIQNVINVNIGTRNEDNRNENNKSEADNTKENSSENKNYAKTSLNRSENNINSASLAQSTKNTFQNRQNEKNETDENDEKRSSHNNGRKNRLLRDLIRILILNRLLRRPHRPNRPPFRPGPGLKPGPRPRPCPCQYKQYQHQNPYSPYSGMPGMMRANEDLYNMDYPETSEMKNLYDLDEYFY